MNDTNSKTKEAMSDDSFYDSDLDEEFADLANRSVHDPTTPFVPVCLKTPRDEKKLSTTLSGRLLGSSESAKASKLVLEECTTEETLTSTTNKTPTSSFIRASFFYNKTIEAGNPNGEKSAAGISSTPQHRKRQSSDNQAITVSGSSYTTGGVCDPSSASSSKMQKFSTSTGSSNVDCAIK